MSSARWPVAVFAYNEGARIVRALDALVTSEPSGTLDIYVLANGCTDDTERQVRDYARRHPFVRLVSIAYGDKANAWNIYVHELAPDAPFHFFTDGDVEVCPGALSNLSNTLLGDNFANGAAALPATGRDVEKLRRQVVAEHGLLGNLYALRGSFIERMRQRGIRLPIGFIGDDGLIGALLKWDLDTSTGWNAGRLVPCQSALFRFESLSPWSLDNWRKYGRRQLRYSLRAYQFAMLSPVLKKGGIAAMPHFMADLYATESAGLSWSSIRTPFDAITLLRLRGSAGTRNPRPDLAWTQFRVE